MQTKFGDCLDRKVNPLNSLYFPGLLFVLQKKAALRAAFLIRDQQYILN